MSTPDLSRVLTTGAGGMVGAYIDFGLRPTRDELDILDEAALLRYVAEHRPETIIHLAAATDMVRCEQDPAYAYALNVQGTYNVARAANACGASMVYVSTSRVFRGDKPTPYVEGDAPEPQTHYGRTKHIGELITASLVSKHLIARTAWVFGGGPSRDHKFHGAIIRKLRDTDEEISALADVYGSPTYGKDLVAAIIDLLAERSYGTFHIANAGEATRYDIASALAAQLAPGRRVHPVDRSHFATGASLPTNEAVISTRCHLRPWKDALTEYVRDEWI